MARGTWDNKNWTFQSTEIIHEYKPESIQLDGGLCTRLILEYYLQWYLIACRPKLDDEQPAHMVHIMSRFSPVYTN